MIIKNYQLNRNSELSKRYKTLLLYGVNEGLKKEFIKKIKQENKNTEIYNFVLKLLWIQKAKFRKS